MRSALLLTLITTACGGAAGGGGTAGAGGAGGGGVSSGGGSSGADAVSLAGVRGHHIDETCNGLACAAYGVIFTVTNEGDAPIARIDALDVRGYGRSLLASGPVACDQVPWTIAGGGRSDSVEVWIDTAVGGNVLVPCGPYTGLGTGVINAPMTGGLPLVGLTTVEVDISGHLGDGTRFNVSTNSVDVTSMQP